MLRQVPSISIETAAFIAVPPALIVLCTAEIFDGARAAYPTEGAAWMKPLVRVSTVSLETGVPRREQRKRAGRLDSEKAELHDKAVMRRRQASAGLGAAVGARVGITGGGEALFISSLAAPLNAPLDQRNCTSS